MLNYIQLTNSWTRKDTNGYQITTRGNNDNENNNDNDTNNDNDDDHDHDHDNNNNTNYYHSVRLTIHELIKIVKFSVCDLIFLALPF